MKLLRDPGFFIVLFDHCVVLINHTVVDSSWLEYFLQNGKTGSTRNKTIQYSFQRNDPDFEHSICTIQMPRFLDLNSISRHYFGEKQASLLPQLGIKEHLDIGI